MTYAARVHSQYEGGGVLVQVHNASPATGLRVTFCARGSTVSAGGDLAASNNPMGAVGGGLHWCEILNICIPVYNMGHTIRTRAKRVVMF